MPNAILRCLVAAALAAACHLAASQDAPARVTVTATRDPVDKSYRKMIAGMERFERNHALAPQATLRFELLPRLPTTQLDGITLRVVGDNLTLPVAVAPDHTFTLERHAQALKEDAALIASRKTSTLTWRAQVRSPGVPAGMRRLGDLRLECQVGVAAGLLSNNAKLFAWLGDLFTDAERVCSSPEGNYLFFSERPLFAVTLHDGARSMGLPFAMLYAGGTQTPQTLPFCDCQVLLDRSYYAPIWDRSWPDDTLISFDDMDAAPGPADVGIAADHRSEQQMRAALGAATIVRFDSGYQAWRYRYPPARDSTTADGKPAYAELVVLFGPDGTARKARLSDPLPSAGMIATDTTSLWQKIQLETSDNGCDKDSQCHSIGVGAKACGGPQSYLAWSSQNSDGAKLKQLIASHAATRRASDAREHMMSTCSLVSDPGAICRAHHCILNPAASNGVVAPTDVQ